MTLRPNISTFISRAAISLLLLLMVALPADAQKLFRLEKDTIPLMRGFQVSFDLVGVAQLMMSDYGQYEAALRLNLHDQWFPIVELGYGKASHEEDVVTGLAYKTQAPYFRVGVDFNLLKKKHQANRLFAGIRYAHTSYKIDVWRQDFPDPVWQWPTGFGVRDVECSQHWAEAVIGLDAQIWGPAHLGWSVRYRQRLSHSEGNFGNSWYVPGYGTQDTSNIGATFNVIIDI
ncbi:MAG: hypothetical protein IJ533_04790 [Prevotella sp.]|nr:hypothetical protein [Prevotella sp.]